MVKESAAVPNSLALNVGAFDPVLGYSFGEIAALTCRYVIRFGRDEGTRLIGLGGSFNCANAAG